MKNHLITCPIFARELEAVLPELGGGPLVKLMDYTVHISPQVMAAELGLAVATARDEGAGVSLLVGRECECLQPIGELADGCAGSLPRGKNCIEILLGRKPAEKLQENRTTIITPAWIRMINNSIADGHWTVEDARLNFGWYDKIILLDVGLEVLDDELILEFFELTGVPIEVVAVSLDHFREVVRQLLEEK
ncbi:MAG: DUF1638 domain-containing protein [Desulfobulbaceae bacterium]|nr:DUF1638 domain-containing protein [Desulfobulbaceae bacterium]HIJ79616.1 DUF1638 domain-containing protein [Deltaproteobacteria bacterium]